MFDLEGSSNDSDSLKPAGACSSCREQRDEHYRCVPPCSRPRSSGPVMAIVHRLTIFLAVLLLGTSRWAGEQANAQPIPLRYRSEAAEQEEEDEIETDRDSFTPATTTAGWGLTIIESGYSFIDN